MIREKKIKSGRLLEVDYYPIWNDGRRMPTRAPKTKPTSEEQKKYNEKRAMLHFVRMINANYDTGDIFLHVTYSPENAPDSIDQVEKDFYNYIRRIKTRRASELKKARALLASFPGDRELEKRVKKLAEPFKYYEVIEENTYKTGKHKGRIVWHLHVFMTGGLERDTIEDMWELGARVNADRYQPERFGLEAAARYCAKNPSGKKRFRCSRNHKKPIESKPRDGKISSRGVEKLARERVDDKAYWERKYRGYRLVRCVAKYNSWNDSWYLSLVLYKCAASADIPPWGSVDDEVLW
jgi:hypothetical protein